MASVWLVACCGLSIESTAGTVNCDTPTAGSSPCLNGSCPMSRPDGRPTAFSPTSTMAIFHRMPPLQPMTAAPHYDLESKPSDGNRSIRVSTSKNDVTDSIERNSSCSEFAFLYICITL